MKKNKEHLQQAIENSAKRLFEDSGRLNTPKLYLTQKQYDLDPEGWKQILRDKGLPEDAIEIIPKVFKP